MAESTSQKTVVFVDEHPHIKSCLKNGFINYSALSRHIANELGISKKTSVESILISLRRYREKLKKSFTNEKKIVKLFKDSEINISNKVHVLIVSKNIKLPELEKSFVIEGSDYLTIITFEKFAKQIDKKSVYEHHKNLALISIVSSEEIEKMTGVVSYITSLLSENGVNIWEFISCYRDTMMVISVKDLPKALELLEF